MSSKTLKILLISFSLTILYYPVVLSKNNMVKNTSYEYYIEQYKDLAIKHMKLYKIPASVTLSQGLLESGAGNSDLSRKSNNHFGIKCNSGWQGSKVIAPDDTPRDCFRKYNHPEESYKDHSLFLTQRERYSGLFSLDITDYKSWARGLQKAGYATDRAYANKLIKIIEDYDLFLYDRDGAKEKIEREEIKIIEPTVANKHIVYKTNGLVYVIAKRDDSFESIANEFNFRTKELCEFNEVIVGYPLQEGDLVYFQEKKKKADKPYFEHKVQVGESMYSISQLYGIKVDNLYKINELGEDDFLPVEGYVLKLR